MKILKTFVFGFLLIGLLIFSKATAISQTDQSLSSSGQIIVKYKNGQSIDDLVRQIREKKENTKEGFFSAVKIALQDLALTINGKESLEVKLYRLIDAEKRAKVVSKKELFTDDSSLNNFYQIKLDEFSDVDHAVAIFRNLPEVEFAELNWLVGGGEYK